MRLTLLRTLILINAVATLAAGVVLFVLPGAIPSVVGITLARIRRSSPGCSAPPSLPSPRSASAPAVGRASLLRIARTERKKARTAPTTTSCA
jgi:hypothetical protein